MAQGDRIPPVLSTRADDPEAAEALDAFVVGLAERIDGLQDTEASGDLASLADACRVLVAESAGLGYEPLAASASAVERACRAGDPGEAHKCLVELTEVSQRVRLGHRGAF